MKYIPLEECEDGCLYKLNSRNLKEGFFDGKTMEFSGLREKFGSHFIDSEIHYDAGPPYGTAKPTQLVDVVDPVRFKEPSERERILRARAFNFMANRNVDLERWAFCGYLLAKKLDLVAEILPEDTEKLRQQILSKGDPHDW